MMSGNRHIASQREEARQKRAIEKHKWQEKEQKLTAALFGPPVQRKDADDPMHDRITNVLGQYDDDVRNLVYSTQSVGITDQPQTPLPSGALPCEKFSGVGKKAQMRLETSFVQPNGSYKYDKPDAECPFEQDEQSLGHTKSETEQRLEDHSDHTLGNGRKHRHSSRSTHNKHHQCKNSSHKKQGSNKSAQCEKVADECRKNEHCSASHKTLSGCNKSSYQHKKRSSSVSPIKVEKSECKDSSLTTEGSSPNARPNSETTTPPEGDHAPVFSSSSVLGDLKTDDESNSNVIQKPDFSKSVKLKFKSEDIEEEQGKISSVEEVLKEMSLHPLLSGIHTPHKDAAFFFPNAASHTTTKTAITAECVKRSTLHNRKSILGSKGRRKSRTGGSLATDLRLSPDTDFEEQVASDLRDYSDSASTIGSLTVQKSHNHNHSVHSSTSSSDASISSGIEDEDDEWHSPKSVTSQKEHDKFQCRKPSAADTWDLQCFFTHVAKKEQALCSTDGSSPNPVLCGVTSLPCPVEPIESSPNAHQDSSNEMDIMHTIKSSHMEANIWYLDTTNNKFDSPDSVVSEKNIMCKSPDHTFQPVNRFDSASPSSPGSTPEVHSTPSSRSSPKIICKGSSAKSALCTSKGRNNEKCSKTDIRFGQDPNFQNTLNRISPRQTTSMAFTPSHASKYKADNSTCKASHVRGKSHRRGKVIPYPESSPSSSPSCSHKSDLDGDLPDEETVFTPERDKCHDGAPCGMPKVNSPNTLYSDPVDSICDVPAASSVDLKNIFDDISNRLLSPIPNLDPNIPMTLSALSTAPRTETFTPTTSHTGTAPMKTRTFVSIPGLSCTSGTPSVIVHISLALLDKLYYPKNSPIPSPPHAVSCDQHHNFGEKSLHASSSTGFLPARPIINIVPCGELSPSLPAIHKTNAVDVRDKGKTTDEDVVEEVSKECKEAGLFDQPSPGELVTIMAGDQPEQQLPVDNSQAAETASSPFNRELIQEKKPDQILAEIMGSHVPDKPPPSIKIPKRKKEGHQLGQAKRPCTDCDVTPERMQTDDCYDRLPGAGDESCLEMWYQTCSEDHRSSSCSSSNSDGHKRKHIYHTQVKEIQQEEDHDANYCDWDRTLQLDEERDWSKNTDRDFVKDNERSKLRPESHDLDNPNGYIKHPAYSENGSPSFSSSGGKEDIASQWARISGESHFDSYNTCTVPCLQDQPDAITSPTCSSTHIGRIQPIQDRLETADSYLQEAKKLKRQADSMSNKLVKSLTYVEAVLSFIQCGYAMEHENISEPSQIFRMYNDTLRLLRHICRGNFTDTEDQDKEKRLTVLSRRIQSLLCLKLFKQKQPETMKLKRAIDDHNKSAPSPHQNSTLSSSSTTIGNICCRTTGTPSPVSPQPSPAGSVGSVGSVGSGNGDINLSKVLNSQSSSSAASSSMVTTSSATSLTVSVPSRIHSITQKFLDHVGFLLQCHTMWDQADEQAEEQKDFFCELDSDCNRLTLQSSVPELVRYIKEGLCRLKDT